MNGNTQLRIMVIDLLGTSNRRDQARKDFIAFPPNEGGVSLDVLNI